MKFEKEVRKLLSGVDVYKERPDRGEVYIEIEGSEFTAEKLFKLSDLLGTGTISISTATRHGGYCETCDFEYAVMILTATGVTL